MSIYASRLLIQCTFVYFSVLKRTHNEEEIYQHLKQYLMESFRKDTEQEKKQNKKNFSLSEWPDAEGGIECNQVINIKRTKCNPENCNVN